MDETWGIFFYKPSRASYTAQGPQNQTEIIVCASRHPPRHLGGLEDQRLEGPEGDLGRSWGGLGVVLDSLGWSWAVLGRCWAVVGRSWEALGQSLGGLGKLLGNLWAVFGAVSGRSWVGHLLGLLRGFSCILELPGGFLRGSWAALMVHQYV